MGGLGAASRPEKSLRGKRALTRTVGSSQAGEGFANVRQNAGRTFSLERLGFILAAGPGHLGISSQEELSCCSKTLTYLYLLEQLF